MTTPKSEETAVAKKDEFEFDLGRSAEMLHSIERDATDLYAGMQRVGDQIDKLSRIIASGQAYEKYAAESLEQAYEEAERIKERAKADYQRLEPKAMLLHRVIARANAGKPPLPADTQLLDEWFDSFGLRAKDEWS